MLPPASGSRLSFSELVACVQAAVTLCLLPAPMQAGSDAVLLAGDPSPLPLVPCAVPPVPAGMWCWWLWAAPAEAAVVPAPELLLDLGRDLCVCRTETAQPW